MYNFTYENIMAKMSERDPLALQMNVFVVAKKYLMDKLAEEALEGVRSICDDASEIADIMATIRLLSANEDHHGDFATMKRELIRTYVRDLFAFQKFRQMLEEPENKEALAIVVDLVSCTSVTTKWRVRPERF